MLQNAPNPFNPTTKIRFSIAKPGRVELRIYNVRGEFVKRLASGWYDAGSHETSWDGSTARGQAPTGIYFAKATVTGERGTEVASDVLKMLMAK